MRGGPVGGPVEFGGGNPVGGSPVGGGPVGGGPIGGGPLGTPVEFDAGIPEGGGPDRGHDGPGSVGGRPYGWFSGVRIGSVRSDCRGATGCISTGSPKGCREEEASVGGIHEDVVAMMSPISKVLACGRSAC